MAEELQHLLDKIHAEAVDKGRKEAEDIVSSARQKAAALVEEAEKKAENRLEQAAKDAEAYTQRSAKTLEQAARDLLISVGQGVENILADVVAEAVEENLSPDIIEKMLMAMAESCARQARESRLELLCSPEDKQELVKFLAAKYRERMVQGIDLHADSGISKGFKISIVEDHVYHDFTKEAIAEALTQFLRPDLAEMVHRVARAEIQREKGRGGKDGGHDPQKASQSAGNGKQDSQGAP